MKLLGSIDEGLDLVNKDYVDNNSGSGHTIEDSTGTAMTDRANLQFIGADLVDDSVNDATQVITPTFREIQGDIPDTPVVCLDGAPIGTITQYGAPISTLDANWLPCLGQAVSRTLYHELFEKIGTTYGSGDGSTTFNVPDYGGKVPVGLDESDSDFDTLGDTLGEKSHTLTSSELPSDPQYWAYAGGNIDWPLVSGVGLGTQTYCEHYVNVGGSLGSGNISVYDMKASGARNPAQHDVAHNNIQPSIVANYIIKAKQASTSVLEGTINNTYNDEINEVYSSSYINSNVDSKFNYSESEQVVGRWIDNKPIYRKVFVQNSVTVISTGLGGIVDIMLNMQVTVKQNSTGDWRNIPWLFASTSTSYGGADWAGGFYFVNSSGNIIFQIGSSLGNAQKVVVILEYTKTTD